MRIIIDSNIIFSSLIKDSTTRKLILSYDELFLLPIHVFIEIEKYKEEILRKSKMDIQEFENLLQLIMQKMNVVPIEIFKQYARESQELIGEHSQEDIIFIACALAFKGSTLWSDDKKLKRQNKVTVLNTSEIMKILE